LTFGGILNTTMPKSITETLAKATAGDWQTMDSLVPAVYAELKAIASSYLHGDRAHTLQPTALVHEAFLKMVGNDRGWSGQDHFKAVAAKAMRQVLVDYARARNSDKRGGGRRKASISVDGFASPGQTGETREMQIEELDQLLVLLAEVSPRMAQVAELRLFGGMETDQIARVSGSSLKMVQRNWQLARAWLAGKVRERSGG
jgi:RNA polymerase sigma-70 factor (ECF subfamily)